MDKKKLKEFLLSLERAHINRAELNYEEFLSDIKHDWSGVEDVDDHSHVVEGEERKQQMERQVIEHKMHLELIESIDFDAMNEVDLGAVVKVNENYLIVAAAEPKFKFEGDVFMGISVSAPIYKHLRGKKAGDEFVFNGRTFRIQEVH